MIAKDLILCCQKLLWKSPAKGGINWFAKNSNMTKKWFYLVQSYPVNPSLSCYHVKKKMSISTLWSVTKWQLNKLPNQMCRPSRIWFRSNLCGDRIILLPWMSAVRKFRLINCGRRLISVGEISPGKKSLSLILIAELIWCTRHSFSLMARRRFGSMLTLTILYPFNKIG